MGLRDGLNRKPAVGVLLVIIVLVAAVTLAVRSIGGTTSRVPQLQYLYDLEANELVTGDVATVGASRVLARVYSCSQCTNASTRFIAHLEKPNPSANLEAGESPILIRAAEGEEWVSPTSEKGMHIAMQADARCKGMPRSECYPSP